MVPTEKPYGKSLEQILALKQSYKSCQIRTWVDEYLFCNDTNDKNYSLVYELYNYYFSDNSKIEYRPNKSIYYFMVLLDDKLVLSRDLTRSPRFIPLNNTRLSYILNNVSILGEELLDLFDEEIETDTSPQFTKFYYNTANKNIINLNSYYYFKYTNNKYYVQRDIEKSPRSEI